MCTSFYAVLLVFLRQILHFPIQITGQETGKILTIFNRVKMKEIDKKIAEKQEKWGEMG